MPTAATPVTTANLASGAQLAQQANLIKSVQAFVANPGLTTTVIFGTATQQGIGVTLTLPLADLQNALNAQLTSINQQLAALGFTVTS